MNNSEINNESITIPEIAEDFNTSEYTVRKTISKILKTKCRHRKMGRRLEFHRDDYNACVGDLLWEKTEKGPQKLDVSEIIKRYEDEESYSLDDRETILYRHFNKDSKLLYIGISVSVWKRTSKHKRSHWFDEVTRIELERYPNRISALKAEAIAVAKEKPLHNQNLMISK